MRKLFHNWSYMKKAKIEALARQLYDKFVGHQIWDQAYKTYPEYNDMGEDTDNATEMILDFILDETRDLSNVKKLNEKESDYLRQCIEESIFAGLT